MIGKKGDTFSITIITIVIILLILLVYLIIYVTSPNSSKIEISENQLLAGESIKLSKLEKVTFEIEEEEHSITINSIGDDSVDLVIRSRIFQVNLKIGEEKKFDLKGDGFYDLKIKLKSINNGVPDIYIQKIHEKDCIEYWNCSDWNPCSEQGSQTRNCIDINSCETTINKPLTTKNCTYNEDCNEDWDCDDWKISTNLSVSFSFSGEGGANYSCIQTRNCEDINDCGTQANKPNETRGCPGEDPNFPEKFENCQPGANTTTYLFGASVHYYQEIIGPEGNLCKIKYKYLKHSDSGYENKETICKLETSLGYNHAYMMSDDNCEGELWEYEKAAQYNDLGEECYWDLDCGEGLMCDEELEVCVEDPYYVGDQCPTGTEYSGAEYSYSEDEEGNDIKIAYPICLDPDFTCTTLCGNCTSGVLKKTYDLNKDTGETIETCVDCFGDDECIEGFHCSQNNCVDNNILISAESCPGYYCDQLSCENCKLGFKKCYSGWSDWPQEMSNKCVECSSDYNCLEGYSCEFYNCVSE